MKEKKKMMNMKKKGIKKPNRCKVCNRPSYGTICKYCYNKMRRKGIA